MKKLLFLILILIPLLFANCSKNSGDEGKPNTGIPITPENILGTWEIYHFTKRVRAAGTLSNDKEESSGTARRHADYDGYRITFDSDGKTYFETNPLKHTTITGEYTVDASASSVTLRYKSPYTGQDSTTIMRITRMAGNESLYTRIMEYPLVIGDLNFEVEDIQYLRNIDKAPDAHPNVEKVSLSRDNMAGSWKVKTYKKTVNGNIEANAGDTIVNSIYAFDNNYKYKAFDPDGELLQEGPYVITDDVIHMYNDKDLSKKPAVFLVIHKSEKSFTHYFNELMLPNNKVPEDWIIEVDFEKTE